MADPSSMLVTETVRPLLVSVQHCALQLRTELDLLPALTCSTCCLLGILYCFWGNLHTHTDTHTHTSLRL